MTVALLTPRIVLKPREEYRLQQGHLWAFSNEILEAPAALAPGTLADLFHAKGGFLGKGFYHPHSLIAFRILTSQKDDVIDTDFFRKRFEEAAGLRAWLYPGATAYRWVFGESDRLPGLIVDRFGDYLSLQILAAGMERFQAEIVEALVAAAQPKGIVRRTDSSLRAMEGLTETAPEIVFGEVPARVNVSLENGVFEVDLMGGQKTGFYFDQRDNRQALAALCKDKKVLDAYCYSGGFGVAAARAGAREVVFADSAHAALELAAINVERNDVKAACTFVEGDALKIFEHAAPGGPFEVICIDPPAYARSKKHVPAALKAYEKLNALAIGALPRGGILATSSCSHHVNREAFMEMLGRAARKAGRSLRLLELRGQSKDHPVLLAMPETSYLKFAILQVV